MKEKENLILVNCYNCGSQKHTLYAQENGYSLVKCSTPCCGLLYVTPRPNDEIVRKSPETGEHEGDLEVAGKYRISKYFRFLRILKDFYYAEKIYFGRAKYWLDIGCGHGEFPQAISEFFPGITVSGVEPNSKKRISCKKNGVHVMEDDSYPKRKYDVISLLNVYPHLPNPPEFFKKLHSMIRKGGELFVETGHTSDLPEKYHHRPYFLPDHLSFANKKIVEKILVESGFKIIQTEIYRSPEIPLLWNPIAVSKTLAKIILRRSSWRNLFRNQKHAYRDMFIRAERI